MGNLPTRTSVKGAAAQPPPPPKPEPRPEPVEVLDENGDRVVPGAVPNFKMGFSWEERMGPVGISLVTVAACVLCFFVARYFHIL
jgi:hypothetical protein